MSESAMTLEQAEEIWMAHQLGMHPGPQSEVAMALLVLANNEERESAERKSYEIRS